MTTKKATKCSTEDTLAEKLARAAWTVLNHDNDWDGDEDCDVESRRNLTKAMADVLASHRGRKKATSTR